MQISQRLLLAVCLLALAIANATAQGPKKVMPGVTEGPAKARLGDVAQIAVPVGYEFVDGNTTREFMKATGQPTSGRELGILSPTNGNWSIMFEFDDSGYVKDDDKDELDADKLLKSIKAGNDAANKERKRMGSSPIEVVGWEQKPHYDATTHNLEWAVRGRIDGEDLVNYNTRLLGRSGVMEVVLVCDPGDLAGTLPTFKTLLKDYSYNPGQTYAEYKSGDKVAKYGLAALVVGGAAAGAAKLGLFAGLLAFLKKGWKLVAVGAVAVAAFVKKLFSRGDRTET